MTVVSRLDYFKFVHVENRTTETVKHGEDTNSEYIITSEKNNEEKLSLIKNGELRSIR